MTTKTTKELNTNEVKSKGWWSLSPEIQRQVLSSLPKQTAWTFVVTRVSDQAWSLDLPEAQTFGELLVGGTNVSMDLHYAELFDKNPVNDDQMMLTCSIVPMEDATTVLTDPVPDKNWEGAATYREQVFGISCWTCPYILVLWGYVPESIYIKLEPTT